MEGLTLLTLFVGLIMSFSNIPQIYKIYSRKSAKDISKITYLMVTMGSAVWLWYGLVQKDIPLIATQFFTTIFFFIIFLGAVVYGSENLNKKEVK